MKTVAAVLALVFAADAAAACSCVVAGPPPTASQLLHGSHAVFTATVLGVEELKVPAGGNGSFSRIRAVALELHQAWRGLAHPNAIIFTGLGGGDCGYPFEVGKSYLVFASHAASGAEVPGALYTSICTATRPVADPGAPPPELEGRRPSIPARER